MYGEYSFIYSVMARQVDENKIQAIKQATIETVVLEGISGASVSRIAERAGVSNGYLYRFYKGKRELLEALLEERLKMIHVLLREQIVVHSSVENMIKVFVKAIYKVAMESPLTVSFSYRLLTDFSFELSKDLKNQIIKTCSEILEIGHRTGEINTSINNEKFYAIVVGGMLNYINIRLRNIFGASTFTDDDIESSIQLLLKTLTPTP